MKDINDKTVDFENLLTDWEIKYKGDNEQKRYKEKGKGLKNERCKW